MKIDGKYKFSLQFPDDSEESHEVGELLERLGNKKSAFLVPVLFAYIREHPELSEPHNKVKIQLESSVRRGELKQMIYEMIEERLQSIGQQSVKDANSEVSSFVDADIEEMLDNLDMFKME